MTEDITADNLELPWTIAPTSEDVLNIPGSVVVIQTEEDLGPKDPHLPM